MGDAIHYASVWRFVVILVFFDCFIAQQKSGILIMSVVSVRNKIETYASSKILIFDPHTNLHWLSFISSIIFLIVFVPLFFIETLFLNYRFSAIVATLVCCWLVFNACRKFSIVVKSRSLFLWYFFRIIKISMIVFLNLAIIAILVLVVFIAEALPLVLGIPALVSGVGFFLIRWEMP